jgi:hypothetical protein
VNGEKFDFIGDFANRQRRKIEAGLAAVPFSPFYGEKVAAGG